MQRQLLARCAICGKPISETFWICEACERGYKLNIPFPEWPKWARYLKAREEQHRETRARTVKVIPVSLLGPRERQEIERLFYGEQE